MFCFLLWVSLQTLGETARLPAPIGQCPFPDLEHPVYLPDSSDPTKFYQCSHGVPYPLYCPDGLHFNPSLNVCFQPKVINSAAFAISSSACPVPDPEDPVYLTDPTDPTKFYECSNGVAYPFVCPGELHFNPYTNRCDYPGFSTPSSTTGPSGPSGTCPYPDPEYPVYLTDLSDPGRFYECSNGVPYAFDCPPGLQFKPDVNVCG